MGFLTWLKTQLKGQESATHAQDSEPKTIGELQNLPISKWGDQDIIKGAKFLATLQLRTPLRILKHHNELFEGDGSPPNYTKELWEGIWVPKAKTFSELGLAIVELPEATMASDIGPIPSNGGDYLKFLLAIRNIVESNNNIPARRKKLTIELKKEEWEKIINKHGGTDKILNYFFPRFIEMLPSLQKETVSQLKLNKINTAEVFAKKTDKELLSIKWNQRYNSQPK